MDDMVYNGYAIVDDSLKRSSHFAAFAMLAIR